LITSVVHALLNKVIFMSKQVFGVRVLCFPH
jgi:hypothetical protein